VERIVRFVRPVVAAEELNAGIGESVICVLDSL
jgi:hypothetical protein